jgi:aspartyl-tRNA(Asn)/glutamyl-tRNA(Gln) amidotransferase subunit A
LARTFSNHRKSNSSSSSSNYFTKAQQVRALIQQDFDKVFRSCNISSQFIPNQKTNTVDVLLTPASMTFAPTIEEVKKKQVNPYVNDVFTIPTSLAGLPAISVPCERDPLPIGLQLIGQYGDDDLVLYVASHLESRVS